jgi:GNAT superfamily N-acetyltransferase
VLRTGQARDGAPDGGREVRTHMARALISVREAGPADLPGLAENWSRVRGALGSRWSRGLPEPSPKALAGLLDRVAASPGTVLLIALVDGSPAGMAYLTCRPLSPLHTARAAHVDYMHVHSGHRRGGVGRALLAAAASYAEQEGATQVAVNVHPGLRDANRFFARWGFAPLTVRRAVPTAVLRRRLLVAAAGPGGPPPNRRDAARRILRLRRSAAPAAPAEPPASPETAP